MGFSRKASSKAQDVVDTAQDQLSSQISTLRAQVEQLLNNKVTPTIADAADRAESAVNTARDVTSTQVENVSAHVRDQPIIAIGIAAAVGYIIGRIAR